MKIEKILTIALIWAGIFFPNFCMSEEATRSARLTPPVDQEMEDKVILDIADRFPEIPERSISGKKLSRRDIEPDTRDADDDGLSDAVEAMLGTRPDRVDSDCDGLLDGEEALDANGNPAIFDQDRDDIADALENRHTDSDNDGQFDDQDPETAIQLVCGRFSPFAITDADSTTFSITAISPGISRLILNPGFGNLELYDDGTHGDHRAGDGVFSRGGINWAVLSKWGTDSYVASKLGVFNDSGEYFEIQTETGIFKLAPIVMRIAGESVVPIRELSDNVWVSDRAVAIVDPELASRVWDGEAREAVIRFLEAFGDRFDFIQIYPNGRGSPSYAANHSSVVNTVEGIGISLFNNRSVLGLPPDGQILGYHWQNNSPGIGATTHEIMHQWQAFAGAELGLGQCVGSHWGILGQGRGVMGGFDPSSLIERSPGLYEVDRFSTCCGVGQLYTPLELYFAGLSAASSVSPMTVPINADCNSLDCSTVSGKCTFEAEGIKMVTIGELVELEGVRVPGYPEAQTHFSLAHVLVTDVPPTPAELSAIEEKAWILENLENAYSFYRISGGRGTVDTLIGPELEIPIFIDGFESD